MTPEGELMLLPSQAHALPTHRATGGVSEGRVPQGRGAGVFHVPTRLRRMRAGFGKREARSRVFGSWHVELQSCEAWGEEGVEANTGPLSGVGGAACREPEGQRR